MIFRSSTALYTVILVASLQAPAFADALVLPPAPAGLGKVDTAPAPTGVVAYVDTGGTNQRGDACLATLEANAGVRLLSGFLDLWTPRSAFVDADQDAPAKDSCPAVVKSDWDGIPGSATDGKKKLPEVHDANIAYSVKVTRAQTPELDREAYLDDRRGKNVSIVDGLGPLADVWRKGARQTTTITDMPADAVKVKYDDKGNNRGVGSKENPDLGKAVDLFDAGSDNGSTEPAKRYYKYARPYRASADVRVVPQLEPAKSDKPASDGGFPSGHTAEGWRDALVMAYLVPQRYQEMVTRAALMGENRIRAGMHQTFDVLGGRVQALAVVAYNLNREKYAGLKVEAFGQAQSYLSKETANGDLNKLFVLAHASDKTKDRFADWKENKAFFEPRMTYGHRQIGKTDVAPVVPKGAEVLLETRLPYLSAEQRRVVLKTTEIASGYPIISDAEGWGRLNLFDAADGYGAFDGDVAVSMDASKGGFNAADTWKNDIEGAGKLTKQGSGSLALSGTNSFSGGVVVEDGALVAQSDTAFGKGDVYLAGGKAVVEAKSLAIGGNLTVRKNAGIQLSLNGGVSVAKSVALEGGKLVLTLADGQKPKAGDEIKLIQAGTFNGKFDEIVLEGFKLTPVYGQNGLSVRIEG